jgi:hypothetical protein
MVSCKIASEYLIKIITESSCLDKRTVELTDLILHINVYPSEWKEKAKGCFVVCLRRMKKCNSTEETNSERKRKA